MQRYLQFVPTQNQAFLGECNVENLKEIIHLVRAQNFPKDLYSPPVVRKRK